MPGNDLSLATLGREVVIGRERLAIIPMAILKTRRDFAYYYATK